MDFRGALMQDDSADQSMEGYWNFCINGENSEESGEENGGGGEDVCNMFCGNSEDESSESALWQMRARCSDDDGSMGNSPVALCECAAKKSPAQAPEEEIWETIVEQAQVESMHADESNVENMMTSSHLCRADLLNKRIGNKFVSLLGEDILVPLRLDRFSAANRARLPDLHARVCATVSRRSTGRFSIDGCTHAAAQSAKIDVLAQMVTRELQHVALVFHTGNPVVTVNTQRYDLEVSYEAAAVGSVPNARQR
eukprot:2932823-Rhodomonas_salina.1